MKKEIIGYEGKYYISDCGSVFKNDGTEIGQWMNDQGYMLVRLSNPRKTMRVHRLVAEAFLKNDLNLPFVNHIDCVRHNNKYENLEWCTQSQNLKHSELLGRMKRDYWKGKRSPNAKISTETAISIRNLYASGGVSLDAIGKKFNISKRTVGRIVKNESYK
jgi:YesN/AraC family two-component response regulator